MPVTARALVQRINRKLDSQDEQLKAKRGPKGGQYFLVDLRRNFLIRDDVDIEELGRKTGVLEDWEELER